MKNDAPQPFQYQGSKRGFARKILCYLPQDKKLTLVEPFAGSAAVSVAAAYYGQMGNFWLNDLNRPLIDLWHEIISDPSELAHHYEAVWNKQLDDPRRYYDEIRTRFNSDGAPADLLYLLSRAIKGAVRYNSDGKFNQSPDNRRLGTRPKTMLRRLMAVSTLLRGKTRLTSFDYRELIESWRPDQFWYMDPPYEGVSKQRDSRYVGSVSRIEFESFLSEVIDQEIPFVLSYDGKTGERSYGAPLPEYLGMTAISVDAGQSASSTLLGRSERTLESLYISPHVPLPWRLNEIKNLPQLRGQTDATQQMPIDLMLEQPA